MRALRIVGICAATAMCVACSIHAPALSDSDLVFGYAMKSEHRGCSRRVTPGLDLRLGGVWSGASLGLSSLLVLHQSTAGPEQPAEERSGFAAPLGWWVRETDGTERWFGLTLADLRMPADAMVFVYHSFVGVDVRTTQLQRGFGIGAARISVLRPDPNGAEAYLLRFSSHDPEEATLTPIDGSQP